MHFEQRAPSAAYQRALEQLKESIGGGDLDKYRKLKDGRTAPTATSHQQQMAAEAAPPVVKTE